MADVITRLKVESSEYDSKIKRAAQSLNEMSHAAEIEGNKIATANKENIALAQSLGKMATVSSNTRGKMSELTAAIEAATIQYNRLSAAEKQGQFGRALNASIGQLQTRLAGLKTEMAAVQTRMGKTNAISSGMGGMGGFGAGLKGGLAMMGPQAAGFAAVAAVAIGLKKTFSDLVNINKEFEQSHANLASVMGKTRGETEALATQAKQLGATTQYTAMQILDLQTNLARLGFSEQEILNSTKAVQALATATNADLGEAANLAGAALRGFGLDASEMDRVSSVLAVSTSKSALSFEKLATAIPIVAPVAKQFGFSIEDTVTMIGKLSDAGMDASSAATATRNIFLKMADGGGKLSQAMGRPVHSVEEFGEALKDMKERGMDLNDILKMVGVRSTAAFAVFADNADTLGKFKGEITNCGDQLDKMVAEQLNTLEGSLKILNSAWEGLMLSFKGSNGILRAVTDKLAELLQAWSNWNNRRQGGEAAISTYTTDMTRQDENKIKTGVDRQLQRGTSAETIIENTSKKVKELSDQNKAMTDLLSEWEKAGKLGWGSKEIESLKPAVEKTFGKMSGAAYEWKDQMFKAIASVRDELAKKEFKLEYAQSKIKVEEPTTSKGLGNDLASNERAKIEAEMQKAIADLDKVNMIKLGKEQEYEDTVYQIKFAAYDRIKKLYAEDTKEYSQWQAKQEQLTIQHQNTTLRLLRKTESEQKKADKAEEKANEEALRKQKALDNKILSGLTGAAKKAKWNTSDLGVDGIKEKINLGVDISEEDWNTIQDKLNERLKSLGLEPIQINFETGNVEQVFDEIKTQMDVMKESLDKLSSGVGAISTIGNAFNDLKGIGEDLAEAFSGEMDAWDSLMTVFNSGIGIMQTVIGVMEAINTLQELGNALSDAKVAKQAAETTAVVSGKGAEAAAESAEAAASGTATAANTAEAASGAGKAMAGIPIVGPVLAIAAIAAVLAAVLAATSKAKSAGKFASGGVVGGNSYSGDRLMAYVNSGETILTPQQADRAVEGIQGAQPQIMIEGRISGTDILLAANNSNRSRGGSRGYYANVH